MVLSKLSIPSSIVMKSSLNMNSSSPSVTDVCVRICPFSSLKWLSMKKWLLKWWKSSGSTSKGSGTHSPSSAPLLSPQDRQPPSFFSPSRRRETRVSGMFQWAVYTMCALIIPYKGPKGRTRIGQFRWNWWIQKVKVFYMFASYASELTASPESFCYIGTVVSILKPRITCQSKFWQIFQIFRKQWWFILILSSYND